MRFARCLWPLAVLTLAGPAVGQSPNPNSAPSPNPSPAPSPEASATPTPRPRPTPPPTPPPTVTGYVVTLEVTALAPGLDAPAKAAPEAQALIGRLRQQSHLVSRFYLAQDLSRQEIVSTDFILPEGTLVQHKAGDRYYAIADPKAKTYLVMDAGDLLGALEGGAGIVNSQYQAKVQHTLEKKDVLGYPCRKSVVTVTYVSQVPFEGSSVLVQQKNDVEVWHTSALVSSAAVDHFFFKFQRDKTGLVRKAVETEIGFPMEVRFVVTQGTGKKAGEVQPGSFEMKVTEVKIDKKLDPEMFRIPPLGFTRTEKNPYFKDAAGSPGR